MGVNDKWIDSFGKIKGKCGQKTFIDILPYVAVHPKGSIDNDLFMQMIEQVSFDLYPAETISLKVEFDNVGQLVKGPVLWNVDSGPGRLANTEGNEDKYAMWSKKMHDKGIIIVGLCPNSTSVTAIMDELFRAFKLDFRSSARQVYAAKIKETHEDLQRKKAMLADRYEQGEIVLECEKPKVNVVTSLNPGDLGKILFGPLEDGFPLPSAPILKNFTKDKIERAFEKLGLCPFTRNLLHNPKVRHEMNQSEETGQTMMMGDLEKEYNELKEKCHKKGFFVGAFDAELPTTTKIERGNTIEEQAQSLANTGKVSSAGNAFRALGSMLYNGEAMLRAREISREMKQKAKHEEAQKKNQDRMSKYEAAREVYEKETHGEKLKCGDLKTLLKFICSEERKDNPSQFKTVQEMKNRLDNCDIPWQNYFVARATVETNVEPSDDGVDLCGDVYGSDDENIGEA